MLDLVPGNGSSIFADTLVAVIGATVSVLSDDRVAPKTIWFSGVGSRGTLIPIDVVLGDHDGDEIGRQGRQKHIAFNERDIH